MICYLTRTYNLIVRFSKYVIMLIFFFSKSISYTLSIHPYLSIQEPNSTALIVPPESIHNSKCHLILFYYPKKLFYQLYHTILQYTQHHKTFFFFLFYLNILFYSFFCYYFSFSLPFTLFLASATID